MQAQDPSAIMDLESTDQGFLVPRTDTASVNASYTPAIGLMIYQTTDNKFYYFDGAKWNAIGAGGAADNLGNHMATQNLQLKNNFLNNDGDDEGIKVNDNGGVSIGTQTTVKQFEVFADSSFINQIQDQCSDANGAELTISPTAYGAQTFVADTTGILSSIQLKLRITGVTGTQVLIELKTGSDPAAGTSLSAQYFNFFSQTDSVYTIPLDTEVVVNKNDNLVMIITYNAGDNGIWQRSATDVYAGGQAYLNSSGWISLPNQDHWFKTFIDVPDQSEASYFSIEADNGVCITSPLKIIDGTEGNNLVLTSDSTGNASWKVLNASSLISNSGVNYDCSVLFSSTLLGIGSNPKSIVSSGTYAYVLDDGNPNALIVIDVSNVAVPVIDTIFVLGSGPEALALAGNYIYVIDDFADDLKIINVTTPSSPSIDGSLSLGAGPKDISVVGNYGYIIDRSSNDLKIVNVSNPASPSLEGTFAGPMINPEAIFVAGNYAYIIDSATDDLYIINVSTPASPSLTGTFVDLGGSLKDIEVDGNYAYCVDRIQDELIIADISTPASPTIASKISVGTNPEKIIVLGGIAYILDDSADIMTLINIANPLIPTVVGSMSTGASPIAFSLLGGYILILDSNSDRLQIFGLSTCPSNTLGYKSSSNEIIPADVPWLEIGGDIVNSNSGDVVINRLNISSSDFQIKSSDLDYMLFVDASADEVGIGTSNPSATLDVRGGAYFNQNNLTEDFRVGSENNDYMLIVDASSDEVGIGTSNPSATLDVRGGAYFNQDNITEDFRVGSTNNDYMLIVDASSDRVGIGTFNPSATLDVRGGAYFNQDNITEDFRVGSLNNDYMFTVNASSDEVGIGTSNPLATLDVQGGAYINQNNTSEDLRVGSLNNDYMLFVDASADEVGIGTNNPGATLDVEGSAEFNGNGGDHDFKIEGDADSGLFFVDASTDRIGISTLAPSYTFDIQGDLNVSGATTNVSDARYKKDIHTLTSCLSKLISLRGVHYFFKTEEFPEKDFNGKLQIGVIAQELEKVYPELVSTADDGYKSVNYVKLTPILIEAIKEQQTIIDNLEGDVEMLKTAVFGKAERE